MTATATLTTYRMYIDGQWVDASSRPFRERRSIPRQPLGLIPRARQPMSIACSRRAQSLYLRRVAEADGVASRRVVATAGRSHHRAVEAAGRDRSPRQRQALRRDEHADGAYGAGYHYYGGLADKIEGAVLPTDKPDTFNYTRYEPLGVIAAIVPWNSPLLLTTWKLAPALAAATRWSSSHRSSRRPRCSNS